MSKTRRIANVAVKQDPLLSDAEELVAFLQNPENRDKLDGPFHILAGSLILAGGRGMPTSSAATNSLNSSAKRDI